MEQTPNILPYFITGMVMMLIGWAMGFFDSNLRTSKKNQAGGGCIRSRGQRIKEQDRASRSETCGHRVWHRSGR
jgi:hypothetical protein